MRAHVSVPNVVTSGNLVAGFLALLVVSYDVRLAAALVLLAALFDWLDGVVARRWCGPSAFGANLDSLADLVSFGVVPAAGLYAVLLSSEVRGLPTLGSLVAIGYLLCGAWRLARFPLVKASSCFVGLPIPAAAVLVMLALSLRPAPLLVLGLAVAVSALMVSNVTFPSVASTCKGATRVVRRPVALRRRRRVARVGGGAGRRILRRRGPRRRRLPTPTR